MSGEREEREKTPLIVDTSFRSNAQGQRKHSALTDYSINFAHYDQGPVCSPGSLSATHQSIACTSKCVNDQ